jgi:hypothetical protein
VEAPVVSACKGMQEDTTTTIMLGWVVCSYVGTGGTLLLVVSTALLHTDTLARKRKQSSFTHGLAL